MDISLSNGQQRTESTLQQWLRVVILAGLGTYFTYNIVSGNLANYINERFVWLSYVAVVLFFALAVFSVYRIVRTDSALPYGLSEMGAQTVTWSVLAVAAIPLVLGTMIPSQPLGAEAVNGSISTNAVRGANESGFTIPPENRNVLEWLREFNQSSNYETFNGQPANVVGFVYREPDYAPNQFMVARFTVACCVADASAIGLPVYYEGADDLETGAWVRVEGSILVDDFKEDVLPIVQAETIEGVPEPEHPYLYP
jgi:uncharacterized repeat protein (TIGR03943 family)